MHYLFLPFFRFKSVYQNHFLLGSRSPDAFLVTRLLEPRVAVPPSGEYRGLEYRDLSSRLVNARGSGVKIFFFRSALMIFFFFFSLDFPVRSYRFLPCLLFSLFVTLNARDAANAV